jgi:hypothetical protein
VYTLVWNLTGNVELNFVCSVTSGTSGMCAVRLFWADRAELLLYRIPGRLLLLLLLLLCIFTNLIKLAHNGASCPSVSLNVSSQ